MLPSEVLAKVLITKGVGVASEGAATATAWALKLGGIGDTPDAVIGLTDTGGTSPNPKFLLDFVHVQALVRSAPEQYKEAYLQAMRVKSALLGLTPQDITIDTVTSRISGITMLSDIALLKKDSKGRSWFSMNFRILFEPAADALTNRSSL